jgi:hypothetical protein
MHGKSAHFRPHAEEMPINGCPRMDFWQMQKAKGGYNTNVPARCRVDFQVCFLTEPPVFPCVFPDDITGYNQSTKTQGGKKT